MSLSDPILREVFVLRPAWETLVGRLTVGVDAALVDPAQIAAEFEVLSLEGWSRLTYLMVANWHANTLDEAVDLLAELRAFAIQGKRPRYGSQAGLSMAAGERP